MGFLKRLFELLFNLALSFAKDVFANWFAVSVVPGNVATLHDG